MALHLNLYHEIEKQKSQSRRDPLRLGIIGLACVALGFALFYFYRLHQAGEVDNQLGQLQSQWDKLDPQQKAAQARQADLSQSINTCDAVVSKIEHRLFWAPLLDQFLKVVPKNVQITRFDGYFL